MASVGAVRVPGGPSPFLDHADAAAMAEDIIKNPGKREKFLEVFKTMIPSNQTLIAEEVLRLGLDKKGSQPIDLTFIAKLCVQCPNIEFIRSVMTGYPYDIQKKVFAAIKLEKADVFKASRPKEAEVKAAAPAPALAAALAPTFKLSGADIEKHKAKFDPHNSETLKGIIRDILQSAKAKDGILPQDTMLFIVGLYKQLDTDQQPHLRASMSRDVLVPTLRFVPLKQFWENFDKIEKKPPSEMERKDAAAVAQPVREEEIEAPDAQYKKEEKAAVLAAFKQEGPLGGANALKDFIRQVVVNHKDNISDDTLLFIGSMYYQLSAREQRLLQDSLVRVMISAQGKREPDYVMSNFWPKITEQARPLTPEDWQMLQKVSQGKEVNKDFCALAARKIAVYRDHVLEQFKQANPEGRLAMFDSLINLYELALKNELGRLPTYLLNRHIDAMLFMMKEEDLNAFKKMYAGTPKLENIKRYIDAARVYYDEVDPTKLEKLESLLRVLSE